MTLCERCKKNEEYHKCSTCDQHLCISGFNTVHFGINVEYLVNQWCTTNVSFVVKYMHPMQKSAFARNVLLYLPGKQEWIVLLQ